MKHIKIFLQGLLCLIIFSLLVGMAVAPRFLALDRNNNYFYLGYTPLALAFIYFIGYTIEENSK